MTALRFESVALSLGGRPVLRGVDLELGEGEVLLLAGRNGVGKTTLLRIAAGDDAPDGGRVLTARGVRVGRLRQEIDPSRPVSVRSPSAVLPRTSPTMTFICTRAPAMDCRAT